MDLRFLPLVATLGLCATGFGSSLQDPAEPAAVEEDSAVVGLELSLKQAVKIALDNNIGLRIEVFREEVQLYTHLGSWGAFDPLATITGTYTDSEQPASSSLSGASVVKSDTLSLQAGFKYPLRSGGSLDLGYSQSNTATNSSFALDDTLTDSAVSLSYTQPLLRGAWSGYNTVEQQKAELRWRQAQQRQREVRVELVYNVAQTYWDLVAALEGHAVQQETVELGRRQLEQNQRRLEVGVGTEVEVLQAETNVATQLEALLQTETNALAADDALKSLLFARAESDSWEQWYKWWDRPVEPLTPLPEVDESITLDWIASLGAALQSRPELDQRRIDIQISEFDIMKAGSEEKAGLDLTLSLRSTGVDGQSDEAVKASTSFDFPTASAALTYSAPLYNRAAENALRSARVGLRSARLVYEQTETGILTEIRAAVRGVRSQAEAVRAAGVSYDLAKRQLEAENSRFEQGLSTNFQVLEYQQQLSQAKANLVA
ncbi:MAG: outer membrane protein, partial [Planctomycetota bacterium]